MDNLRNKNYYKINYKQKILIMYLRNLFKFLGINKFYHFFLILKRNNILGIEGRYKILNYLIYVFKGYNYSGIAHIEFIKDLKKNFLKRFK